jgi:CelD/BcsL family acetyltransferase involved in cellulose biosynthesis
LARRYLASYGVRVLVWRDGGELVGVAPFSLIADRPPIRPLRQLALWGTIGPRLRGLVDVLARDDMREAVLDGMSGWLGKSREWDVLRVVRPQADSPTPARLREEARLVDWSYHDYSNVRSTTFQIDLPDSIEAWVQHLDAKDRRSLRARERRFLAFRGGSLTPSIDESELTEALDAIEKTLARRWGEKEVYFRGEPRFGPLLHEAIPRLISQGAAWVSVARDESGVMAGLISIAQNGYAMSLLMAATPDAEYRQFSLGDQIHDVAIGEAVRRACHTYDLLWMGGYKESFWHATPRHLESATVGRGIVGKLAARALARRA